VRFPFGRGARQREIDGLRQRIAELQDEITKIQDSLAAESPDIETTDAYRSVQLLRESMRREELATLREELRGLEARVETLTADRRTPVLSAEASEAAAAIVPDAEASTPHPEAEPQPALATAPTAEVAGEPGQEAERDATAVPSAVMGRGLPSERAIIEPALPPRSAVPAEVAPEEAAEAKAEAVMDEEPALAAQETVAQAGEPAAELDEARAEVPEGVTADEAVTPVAVGEPAAEVAAPEAETPVEVEASAALEQPPEAETPAAAEPPAEGGPAAEPEAVAVEERGAPEPGAAEAEAAEKSATEAVPGRRSSRLVLLLLALAVIVIAVVLALESGLVGPVTGTAPNVVATALPTRVPSTVAPTAGPPAVFPTLLPSPAPPTVPPLAAAPDEPFAIEGLTAPEVAEVAIDRGTIAAPPGFTGALLRATPVLAARNLQVLPNGATVEILPGNATGSGFNWLRVRSVEGVIGWVISTVLGR